HSPSHLKPKLDDFDDVDRKQHGVKQKHRIKVSCNAIEDEQNIACDRKPTQRHDSVHAKSHEHGHASPKISAKAQYTIKTPRVQFLTTRCSSGVSACRNDLCITGKLHRFRNGYPSLNDLPMRRFTEFSCAPSLKRTPNEPRSVSMQDTRQLG